VRRGVVALDGPHDDLGRPVRVAGGAGRVGAHAVVEVGPRLTRVLTALLAGLSGPVGLAR
jgi:hypothetical protein